MKQAGTTLVLTALVALGAGCPGPSLTACNVEPDVSGAWTFTLDPVAGGIKNAIDVEANLQQVASNNALGLGSALWGKLTSSDKGAFDTVMIPQLVHNNGSKTGAIFGCELKINVPIATPVTDDNVDQGPLRISLTGNVVAKGKITGDVSSLIRVDDATMSPLGFTWTGAQH
jgi:hypothetical protein